MKRAAPYSWGNDVKGFCPACGNTVLFVGMGGHVTCSWQECPNPSAASDLLEKPPEQAERKSA